MSFNPVVADGLPHFLDRADGTDFGAGPVGAPTPAGAITIQGPLGATDYEIQEDVDSPTLERAEQATITKSFHDLTWADACTRILSLGRGGILIDRYNNQIRILSSTIQSQRGDKATLKIVAEGLSFDTPPDEFTCTPVELGINIIKHPRYYFALNPASDDYNNYVTVGDTDVSLASVKQAIIRAIQTYQDSPFFPSADNINGLIQNNIISQVADSSINVQVPIAGFDANAKEDTPPIWDGYTANLPDGNYRYAIVSVPANDEGILMAQAAAQELIQKLWKIEDSPYMVGFEITWSVYYYRPYPLNPGGYVENPITESNPALPDYFYSPSNPPDTGTSIFDDLAWWNPQCYSDSGMIGGVTNMSCLRKSDTIEYQRTWFKVTRSWLCSAIGVWDPDICSSGDRPQVPSDYHLLT